MRLVRSRHPMAWACAHHFWPHAAWSKPFARRSFGAGHMTQTTTPPARPPPNPCVVRFERFCNSSSDLPCVTNLTPIMSGSGPPSFHRGLACMHARMQHESRSGQRRNKKTEIYLTHDTVICSSSASRGSRERLSEMMIYYDDGMERARVFGRSDGFLRGPHAHFLPLHGHNESSRDVASSLQGYEADMHVSRGGARLLPPSL